MTKVEAVSTASQRDGSRPSTVPAPGAPDARPRRTPLVVALWRSAVGKKWAMAVSGIVLLGYVLAHMIGNLKVYLGREEINAYAEWLRNLGEPAAPRTVVLWLMRVVLIGAFVVHIVAAAQLTQMNRRARPQRYRAPRDYVAANFAARTMRWTGIIVVLFLAFHLADLTWGAANPDFVRGDPYDNLFASFERVPVATFYILANLALGLHIFHGAWSMFQSMGINSPRYNRARRWFAVGFAALITVGNVSMPLLIVTKVVEP